MSKNSEKFNLTSIDNIVELPSKKSLTMLVGVPCSGKSTLAKILVETVPEMRKVISSDAIRRKILNYEETGMQFDEEKEAEIWHEIEVRAYECITSSTWECILDATNIHHGLRYPFVQMARCENRQIRMIVLLVSREIVIERNEKRKDNVPLNIIEMFFRVFELPTKEEYDIIQFYQS